MKKFGVLMLLVILITCSVNIIGLSAGHNEVKASMYPLVYLSNTPAQQQFTYSCCSGSSTVHALLGVGHQLQKPLYQTNNQLYCTWKERKFTPLTTVDKMVSGLYDKSLALH